MNTQPAVAPTGVKSAKRVQDAKEAPVEQGVLDCLLVHVAKSQTYYPPLNVYQSSNQMAIGLLALADVADREGYRVRVLHEGLEAAIDKRFSFSDYLHQWKPRTIGFSLHFHHACVDMVRLATEARSTVPSATIFTGGFTASFFAREILEAVPAVDAVIQGDAEEPLAQLLQVTCGSGSHDFSGVPNLVWRRNGEFVENPRSYQTSEEMLNSLVYTRFDLLEHGRMYPKLPKAFIKTNLPSKLNLKLNEKISAERHGMFWGLPVGRGCVFRCFYCGGGAKSQMRINQRKGVIFRSHEKVIETIHALKEFGYTGCYVSFDPHPWSHEYFVKLFHMLRERKIKFDFLYSGWGLPSNEFLDEFAKIATPRSAFLVSPETGSDELRRKCKTNFYTNQQLLDKLEHADRLGLRTVCYFCIGVAGETETEFTKTLALKNEIESRFQLAKTEAFLIEMEPGAPWHLDPERYHIHQLRRSFTDFVRDQSSAWYSSMSHLGYTSEFFGSSAIDPAVFDQKMLKLRCKHFCNQNLKCYAMRGVWSLSRLAGIAPRPKNQLCQ